jgi:epoxyqueuosine reductase QueG
LFDPLQIAPEEWLSMSEEEFAGRFSATPLKRSGLERIKRNIEERLNCRAKE